VESSEKVLSEKLAATEQKAAQEATCLAEKLTATEQRAAQEAT
jgi:hypothetical protein